MEELLTFIESFGFPTTVCLICFYFIFISQKTLREDSKSREDLLFQRIGEISKCLSEVVATLERINDRISKIEERVERNE